MTTSALFPAKIARSHTGAAAMQQPGPALPYGFVSAGSLTSRRIQHPGWTRTSAIERHEYISPAAGTLSDDLD
jgi:hypothetical protein